MSNKPIRIKLDVTKLDKSLFFHSERTGAVYCDLVAWENKNGPSQYGDTHGVKQQTPKDSDIKTEFVGNLTMPEGASGGNYESSPASRAQDAHNKAKADGYAPDAAKDEAEDDIPF